MQNKTGQPVRPDDPLRVTEIFYSLQGESRNIGFPTVFIRLTGCPLRCGYCDTAYAFSGGEWMEPDDILCKVGSWPTRYVTVTGGEPLAQQACLLLLSQLCDQGYQVSLETSGALDVGSVDHRVSRVMDLKTPGSGEQKKNRYDNIKLLNGQDQVKFVICDRADFNWALAKIQEYNLEVCCEILISPVYGKIEPSILAEWVLESGVQARFQLQLHKQLWGDRAGR